jgi:microcystin-dependent protein
MGTPFVGEIRMFAGNFAPAGWLFCDGSLLPISEYETLFQLIGTTYGGDGQATFALPDLRSRVPVHAGNGVVLAETGGVEAVTLTVSQIPAHTHTVGAGGSGNTQDPTGAVVAQSAATVYYPGAPGLNAMLPATLQPAGGSQPHSNMQPYLGINFIISLFGIFPSPS